MSTRLPDARVRYALDSVIDQATRAGVVIYSLDCRGLQTGGLQAADNIKTPTFRLHTWKRQFAEPPPTGLEFNRDTQEGMAYLAEQTGGFAVSEHQRPGARARPHRGRCARLLRDWLRSGRWHVRAQRQDADVSQDLDQRQTARPPREDAKGVSRHQRSAEAAGPAPPAEQFVHAATSPFAATTSHSAPPHFRDTRRRRASFVRTLLHIDARALTFAAGESRPQVGLGGCARHGVRPGRR